MSSWNYRVQRRTVKHSDGSVEEVYAIYEHYYDPDGWSAEPAIVTGENMEAIKDTLSRMLEALDDEIVEMDGDPH